MSPVSQDSLFSVSGSAASFWSYHIPGTDQFKAIGAPVLCMENVLVTLASREIRLFSNRILPHGVHEQSWRGVVDGHPDLSIELLIRQAPDNPVLRFRYRLHARRSRRLTNDAAGNNSLTYLRLDLATLPQVTELRFSAFLESAHSSVLEECAVPASHFLNALRPMGPLLTATDGEISQIVAYEHGSQFPNKFLEFRLSADRSVTINAVKGNYSDGRLVDADHPFETVWFQFGAVQGTADDLAAAYRDFVLRWQSPNTASREPWIFYNTWNYQERLKNWQGRSYLAEMNQERMLAEIEIASRMGIEVFVIDTGWYSKTGDWQVDRSRFPDGLKAVKDALDSHGMRLGLWFNPTIAALSSDMWARHQDCIQEYGGQLHPPKSHWEGAESQSLCLVSRYADAYAAEMIRLARETGVTYFKWDAIEQEGECSCDAKGHYHGGPENSVEERNASYGFEQVRSMTRIIDQVCEAIPEAIFDFDITERGRSVGLAFLSAGKYFLINNGPYHWNYDIPKVVDNNPNLLFFPGPARAWICRTPLVYDKWIPSVLFLTHYLPDSPVDSQWINAVSLMLGQNGIWGDLLSLDEENVTRWHHLLTLYKHVRHDVAAATPVRSGQVGGSLEVHEKIALNGGGLIALFASSPGTYQYLSHASQLAPPITGMENIEVSLDSAGRALVEVTFSQASARVVFFNPRDSLPSKKTVAN